MTDLPPGPELDEHIGYLMGWHWCKHSKCWFTAHIKDGGEMLRHEDDWSPSTNIAHAWEVVEKMSGGSSALWWNMITGFCPIPGFEDMKADNGMSLHSFTNILALKPSLAPHAICLAALAAISKSSGNPG